MRLMCEQVQNKPVVSGMLARSSIEVCNPPLGACRNDSLKRSWLTQTLWVIFRSEVKSKRIKKSSSSKIRDSKPQGLRRALQKEDLLFMGPGFQELVWALKGVMKDWHYLSCTWVICPFVSPIRWGASPGKTVIYGFGFFPLCFKQCLVQNTCSAGFCDI